MNLSPNKRWHNLPFRSNELVRSLSDADGAWADELLRSQGLR
ncbi:hypothetical protein [Trichocoleus sp. FACHB-69]|nr:hypothetical protein [Trichocoleus sp. FACHB-69]